MTGCMFGGNTGRRVQPIAVHTVSISFSAMLWLEGSAGRVCAVHLEPHGARMLR